MMLWGVGTPFASESTVTLEDRVAALTAELAQVKAETAKLRERQGDTSEELSHVRAGLANAEIGLGAPALRTLKPSSTSRTQETLAIFPRRARRAE